MIYLKDGLEFLKSLDNDTVDLVLTDPPYQISKETGMQASKDSGKGLEKFRLQTQFGEWDSNFGSEDLYPFIQEIYRVLRKGGTFICFYDLWKLTTLSEMMKACKFKQLRFIEWVKTNPVPVNSKINYLTNAREIALTGVKGGKPTFNSSYDNGIYEEAIYQGAKSGPYKERIHPTQKSVRLFENLILKHSNDGDLVVDPFLGSGTTFIAAMNKNRKFKGSEISEEYYEKMKKRIEIFYSKYYNAI